MLSNLAITWSLSGAHGWGVYGINLFAQLAKRGYPKPVLLGGVNRSSLQEATLAALASYIEQGETLKSQASANPDKKAHLPDTVILHSLGNAFHWGDVTQTFEGDVNIGVVFFEDADLSREALERANRFDGIIAGSTWNADVMKRHGIKNVKLSLQGVDTSWFTPKDKLNKFGERFVVYSGGKLEFRKGQDIAIAAFREFNKKYPDSVLVTTWQNQWPKTLGPINVAGHVAGQPNINEKGTLGIADWVVGNGVPPESFVDLGVIPNYFIPSLLAEADVGLFLSRCEGGTNLAAMEAMACGVPCILSANTGHLDLINGDNCYPLRNQSKIVMNDAVMTDWGETSVASVVEALEQAYQDHADRRRRSMMAAATMRDWSWGNRVSTLLAKIDEITTTP